MALAQEDIELIRKMIQESMAAVPEADRANVRYELELRESWCASKKS